jgi:hypothetical protein
VKSKSITSTVVKPVPPPTSTNPKGGVVAAATARTIATKSALPGPVTSAYHKSTVSLGSRPAGVARVVTSTVRRPHTVLDVNKKRDKPAGVHGALMLVHGDVVGEDFLFDV